MFSTLSSRTTRHAVFIAVAVLCLTGFSLAQETGNCTTHVAATRPDCAEAIAFFQQMQAAVNAGDKNKLSLMVSFPIRAVQNGNRVLVRTRQQFLDRYSQIFSPEVVCAVKNAKISDVWGNDRGFMIGNGVIWWDAVIPASVKNPQPDPGKYPFKIIAINNDGVTVPGCSKAK